MGLSTDPLGSARTICWKRYFFSHRLISIFILLSWPSRLLLNHTPFHSEILDPDSGLSLCVHHIPTHCSVESIYENYLGFRTNNLIWGYHGITLYQDKMYPSNIWGYHTVIVRSNTRLWSTAARMQSHTATGAREQFHWTCLVRLALLLLVDLSWLQ